MSIIYDIRNVIEAIEGTPTDNLSFRLQILETIANVLFLGQHWYFSSHYLKVACLLNLLF
jgi:hypothetical protein